MHKNVIIILVIHFEIFLNKFSLYSFISCLIKFIIIRNTLVMTRYQCTLDNFPS